MTPDTPKSALEQISTCWPTVHNPVQFVMRYARAIQKYVAALVRDPHAAEEVSQDFLVRVFDRGFCPENVSRGRFRDYLKAAVRYVAISHLRQRRTTVNNAELLAEIAQPDSPADKAWRDEWRECVLERAWRSLESEQQSGKSVFYAVLRQFSQEPKAGSEVHAARLSQTLGRPVRAEAFRQQLHRARRHFAQLVIREIRQTLQNPTSESVEEELIDLELIAYTREFLR